VAEADSGSDFLYVIVSPVGNDVRAYRIESGLYTPVELRIQR